MKSTTKQIMKTIFLSSIFLLSSFASFGQEDNGDEYGKTLKKMFEVAGTEKTYQTVIDQMISMYKEQFTMVDEEIWEELGDEISKTSIADLVEMLTPVYAKYLTLEDLEAIIEFYETPVGKKFAKNTPLILQDSMEVGQKWGEKLGRNFIRKMEEKGY